MEVALHDAPNSVLSVTKPGPVPGEWRDTTWELPFLQTYIEWGSIAKSCKIAGIPRDRFYERKRTSESFKQHYLEAKKAFVEGLEEDMVRLGRDHKNVIAILARLKAERPEKYHEKLQVEGRILRLNVSVTDDEAKTFLRAMLAAARPTTLAAIAEEVPKEPIEDAEIIPPTPPRKELWPRYHLKKSNGRPDEPEINA